MAGYVQRAGACFDLFSLEVVLCPRWAILESDCVSAGDQKVEGEMGKRK